MVKNLHAKTSRVTGASDSVAEALSATLRVRREECKVAGLTSVTSRTSRMSLAHTVTVALAAPGASQGAGAGPAGGEVHEADGALVALGSSEARPAHTVSSSKASVSQFIILGIIGSCIDVKITTNLVTPINSLRPVTAAVTGNTRVWVKARDSLWSVVTIQAALAVHPGRFVPTIEANTSSRELSCRVQAAHFSLHLRVEVALVGVTKALAHLAVVP